MAQLKGIRLDLWLGVSLNSMGWIMRKHLAQWKKSQLFESCSHWLLASLGSCGRWMSKMFFLHGELDKDIYMVKPRGFESKIHPEYVCKLKKELYGLKQAPRAWYRKIGEFLVQSSIKVAPSDSSLFVKEKESRLVIVLVYVDDLIITGNFSEEI